MPTAPGILDLGSPRFWGLLLVGAIMLRILGKGVLRSAAFAGLNFACLFWLAGWPAVIFAALLAGLCALLARSLPERTGRGPAQALGVATVILFSILFLIHKRPGALPPFAGAGSLKVILVASGFSYVALRLVELLRAIWESRARHTGGLDVVNYLFPFHMLAAGPIQSWDDYRKDLELPLTDPTFDDQLEGMEVLAAGLVKKFVLAQTVQVVFLSGFQTHGLRLLLEIQAHYLWIFLDFSAYSDIALGAGKLMGIATPRNFNHPFKARNIIDFWERWHMSLSGFVRRNLFTPTLLHAMRRFPGLTPLVAGSLAFLVAFVTCGLWHGFSYRFLIWGFIHAVAVILCYTYSHLLQRRLRRQGVAAYLDRPWIRALATLITFEFVAFSLAFVQHPGFRFLD